MKSIHLESDMRSYSIRVRCNIEKQTYLLNSMLYLSVILGTKRLRHQRAQALCHSKLYPPFPEKLP